MQHSPVQTALLSRHEEVGNLLAALPVRTCRQRQVRIHRPDQKIVLQTYPAIPPRTLSLGSELLPVEEGAGLAADFLPKGGIYTGPGHTEEHHRSYGRRGIHTLEPGEAALRTGAALESGEELGIRRSAAIRDPGALKAGGQSVDVQGVDQGNRIVVLRIHEVRDCLPEHLGETVL